MPHITRIAKELSSPDPGRRADAQKAIASLFFDELTELARRKLSSKYRRRIDPEAAANSALRTFFSRAKDGRLEITDRSSLGGLLRRIAVRKLFAAVKHHRAAKRDADCEVEAPDSLALSFSVAATSPALRAQLRQDFLEIVDRAFDGLRPELAEALYAGFFQGLDDAGVAAAIGQSRATVREFRRLLERQWAEHLDTDSGP